VSRARENGLLRDRVALISGGAQGIGKAIAQRFQEEGARVVLLDIDEEAGRQAQNELAAVAVAGSPTFLSADLARPAMVQVAMEKLKALHPHLHILVNNAGIEIEKPFPETSLDDWDRTMNVNLRGAFLLTQCALHLFPPEGGCVVNVSSIHATHAFLNAVPYACSKAALLALGRNLALELAPKKIRVNTLCPGYIDTRLWHEYVRNSSNPGEIAEQTTSLHPVGRRGLPEDVAEAALFLASDQSAFITGTHLTVDGGLTIRAHP
jgi:NAD(P)-dependent dehydrogenase (short-subunit alcohol dehydrogenase family)